MRNFIKLLLNPTYLFNFIRKRKIEKQFRSQNLTVGINSSVTNSTFGKNVFIGEKCQVTNSKMGNYSYLNNDTLIKNTIMGSFCSIGSNVFIGVGKHPTHMVSTHPAFYANNKGFKTFADKMYFDEYDSVAIGHDVWIGSDVKLLGKIKVGNGAIIATGSVVTKDVPAYAIYGGIPAKLIKYRFNEAIINELEAIKWWELDDEWIKTNFREFHDIEKFISTVKSLKS